MEGMLRQIFNRKEDIKVPVKASKVQAHKINMGLKKLVRGQTLKHTCIFWQRQPLHKKMKPSKEVEEKTEIPY